MPQAAGGAQAFFAGIYAFFTKNAFGIVLRKVAIAPALEAAAKHFVPPTRTPPPL